MRNNQSLGTYVYSGYPYLTSIEWPFYKKYYVHKYSIVFLLIVYDCVIVSTNYFSKTIMGKEIKQIVSNHPNLELSFVILIIVDWRSNGM